MDDSQALSLAVWLARLPANSIHLEANEGHACNYMSAAEWIERELEADGEESDFHDLDPEELQRMRDTNIIWSLQIYPTTPIGSHRWVAPTMFEVIAKARRAWPEVEKWSIPSHPKFSEEK